MMRSWLIRGGVAVIVLAALWLVAARPLTTLIDQVSTVPVATQPASPIGWNGVFVQLGGQILDLEGPGPGYQPAAALSVGASNRLEVSAHGRGMVLGPRAGVLPSGDEPIPAYVAGPGDVASLSLTRSWLSWPVFELNFMTGQSPTWRRNLYYHLTWTKRSGARLDMLWRFEQGFYPSTGWAPPGTDTREGVTGLIRAEVTPASGPSAGQ